MTDEQIIKALECFKSEDCLGEKCPYYEQSGLCGKPMCSDVYDFIYRQKAQINGLQDEVIIKTDMLNEQMAEIKNLKNAQIERIRELTRVVYDKEIAKAKSEAIKEFVSALKGKVVSKYEYIDIRVFKEIDALAKEMTEPVNYGSSKTENNDKE